MEENKLTEREVTDICEDIFLILLPLVKKEKKFELEISSGMSIFAWYDRYLKKQLLVFRNMGKFITVVFQGNKKRVEFSQIFGSLQHLFDGIPIEPISLTIKTIGDRYQDLDKKFPRR